MRLTKVGCMKGTVKNRVMSVRNRKKGENEFGTQFNPVLLSF